ncbi:ankyrin repeat-containing domain protein [Apiospora arundinis]
MTRLAIEKSANADARGKYGRTPLSYTAQKGNEALAMLLHDSGANPWAEDQSHRPLFYAIRTATTEIRKPLIRHEGNFNARDHYGTTALSVAARFGLSDVLSHIWAFGNIDTTAADDFGRSPAWFANRQGHTQIMKALLEYPLQTPNNRSKPSCLPDSFHP